MEILYGERRAIRARNESAAAYRRRLAAERQVIDRWMTFQFGVKPLMYDLEGAANALNYWRFERQNPLRATFKGGGKTEWFAETLQSTTFELVNKVMTAKIKVKVVATCHYSLCFDVIPSSDRTLQQLGLTNPALVAWELVRASWLIDYGLGVGNWIKSMTKLDGMKFVEGSQSLIARVTAADNAVSYHMDSGNYNAVCNGTCNLDVGRFVRNVLTQPPLPGFAPSVKNRLKLRQLANALGFLTGLANMGNLRV